MEQNIFSIHYSCSGFYNGGSLAPSICCIALYDINKEKLHSFNIDKYLKQGKSLMESEKLMLKDFVKFFNTISKGFFVHWLMDGPTFGFKAIYARCENFGIEELGIYDINAFNLSDSIGFTLLDALEENNCKKVTVLSGKDEATGFHNKNYKLVALSTEAKAYGLAELFKKFTSGNWNKSEKTEKELINTPNGIKLYKMLCDISSSQEKIYEIMSMLKTDEDRESVINFIDNDYVNINIVEFYIHQLINCKKAK